MERRAALVTGGGTGLGRAIAEMLVRAGINCMVTGRRRAPLVEVAEYLRDAPGTVIPEESDITLPDHRARLVKSCVEQFGRLDVLVNNAGVDHAAPLLDYDEDGWRRVMATNLDAPFFLSQQALMMMRDRHWGRIVNITSVYASLALNNALYGARLPATTPADRGPVRSPAYQASKAGLLNLTRELAVACAPWGITVNAVTPGMVPLPVHGLDEDAKGSLLAMTPLGRFGRPEDIANAVRFLASEESSFVTGAELVVDGGWTIW